MRDLTLCRFAEFSRWFLFTLPDSDPVVGNFQLHPSKGQGVWNLSSVRKKAQGCSKLETHDSIWTCCRSKPGGPTEISSWTFLYYARFLTSCWLFKLAFCRIPLVLASLLIYSCYCSFCPTLAHVPDTCRLLKFITSHFYLCINQLHQLMALGHRITRIFFIHCFQVSPLGSGQAIPPTAFWCSFDFPSVDHKPPGFLWALWTNVMCLLLSGIFLPTFLG